MLGSKRRLARTLLLATLLVNLAVAWYPFKLDTPKRIDNTAARHANGAWDMDKNSRVIASSPAVVPSETGGPFELTVMARSAVPNQSGPARLFSIARSPWEPGFVIGLERDRLVVRLPCKDAGGSIQDEAEWKIPLASAASTIKVVLHAKRAFEELSVEVNERSPTQLLNGCPAGCRPGLPPPDAPWAVGNVYSGHRPFVGSILRLELVQGGRPADLLKNVAWNAPKSYWLLPERLYEPSRSTLKNADEGLAALWHFVAFVPLGYFSRPVDRAFDLLRPIAGIGLFVAVLNCGKLVVSGRHSSFFDALLNIVGAIVGYLAIPRRATVR